ncbi:S8 family serine peptidase [Streptomyces olivaceiscleroticus]|uniref:Type VII secretion-associated serine protease mycosin n=1 Tax=Streptomyces olivaceiscleroticus TaxID=68245 RepID=A0ABN0ZUP7_9ACTN
MAEDVRSRQWYLDDMQAEDMWKVSTGRGVKVAVIDSGVNSSTPALRGQVLPGKDFTGVAGGATDDYDGHGTTMAELIAGHGKDGSLQGLAPDAKIIPYRVPFRTMKAKSWSKTDPMGDAVRAAANSEAKIINMSFGARLPSRALTEAVEYAASKGKLLIAGTGNDGETTNAKSYPAAYPDVAGIASLSESGKVSGYSTSGDYTTLSAPGSDIPHWCEGSFKGYCDGDGGTSASTAIASASAALIWSKHPKWTANQVLRVLIETAGRQAKNDKASKYIGYGAVRPRMNLLEGKGDPGDPDQSPLYTKSPKSPKPGAPESTNGDVKEGDKTSAVARQSDQGNGMAWKMAGAGIAVLAVVAGAFVFLRRRRA